MQAVALFHAVGKMVGDFGPHQRQATIEYGGRRHAVGIVVAVNNYLIASLDRAGNPGYGSRQSR